jgi:hypothetical protein
VGAVFLNAAAWTAYAVVDPYENLHALTIMWIIIATKNFCHIPATITAKFGKNLFIPFGGIRTCPSPTSPRALPLGHPCFVFGMHRISIYLLLNFRIC